MKTYDEWLKEQSISPVSPEAYYAELAWQAALESIPKAEPVANPYTGTGVPSENWQRGYDGLRCLANKGSDAYKFWLEGKAAKQPPSTAALQKRIEELEAQVFADKPLSVDDTRRIFHEWEHADEIPHGLYARFKLAESAKTALKAGDVQAPKEGWKPNEAEILKFASEEELFLFADQEDLLAIANGILELVQLKIAAAPTDTEGSE